MTQEEKNEKLKSLRFKLNQFENAKYTYENKSDKMINKDSINSELEKINANINFYNQEIEKLK